MSTFYFTLRVTPNMSNPDANEIEGAYASCWVCDDDPIAAISRICFKIKQYDWDIIDIEDHPSVVTAEDFAGKDIGLEHFNIAQEQSMSFVLAAWAKDGKSSYGPVKLERPDSFDLDAYISGMKKLSRKGRCLHYDAGNRCAKIIDAHSIQKNGVLSLIAEVGKVYTISKNFSDIIRNHGGLSFTKQGINTVSTFRGFCSEHDNQLFEPIDKCELIPTKQQILLYSFRALCREIFVKKNVLTLMEEQKEKHKEQKTLQEAFEGMYLGTKFSLKNLLHQKHKYESSIKTKAFEDIKSVVFVSEQEPSLVFSGLFYPDFDFLGRQLQDLSDHERYLDLLTFSFAPMKQGWGFIFAWHTESSDTCIPFMQSLATRSYDDNNLEDNLFRLVVSCCENLAIRPQWWESLQEQERVKITKATCHGVDVFTPIRYDYLAKGLENISSWKFESVISDMA